MIEKLKPHPCIDANGVVYGEIQPDNQEMTEKINELIDAVNELQATISKTEKVETPAENARPPYMQNKRLRKALGIAQSALVKLANEAYDMDEHIYIDKILNQIERITKGGDNE